MYRLVIGLLLLSACGTAQPVATDLPKTDVLKLYDSSRNREVPVGIYYHAHKGKGKQKIALFNHGYGAQYADYSSILGTLEAAGYFVIAIQHELPGDAPMPTTGDIITVRKPYWQRGVDNMLFVLQKLQAQYPNLDYNNLVLIGHSNGGDMSMLFAHQHPKRISKVISLDNRRMPFPRTSQPRIYSLRSSDQPADAGVLPTAEEAKRYKIQIVNLPATTHNDMGDRGTATQQAEIKKYIEQFLRL